MYGGEQSGFAGAAGGCGRGSRQPVRARAAVAATGLGGAGAALAATAVGRSVAAIAGNDDSLGAGSVVAVGRPDSGGTGAAAACVGEGIEVDDEAPADALPWEADATQAMPDTTRPTATTPTAAMATGRREEARDRSALSEFATGRPVVAGRGESTSGAEDSVRFGTDSGTVIFGAVVIGALCRSWYARRTPSCIRVASSQRFSLSKASARSTTCATAGLSLGSTDRIGGAGLVIALSSSSLAVRPSCTSFPVSACHIVAPTDQTSLRPSTWSQRPRACSGDMKAGVPIADPDLRGEAGRRQLAKAGDAEVEHLELARTREEDVRGLDVPVDDALRVRGGEHVEELVGDRQHVVFAELSPASYPPVLERLAVEQLGHEVERPVLGGVVVDHLDGTVVGDGVRRVALAGEAGTHVGAGRKLGVQHLDGHASAVPVCRGVDGGHTAHAEKHVQPPLATERLADALARPHDERVEKLGQVVVVLRRSHVPSPNVRSERSGSS